MGFVIKWSENGKLQCEGVEIEKKTRDFSEAEFYGGKDGKEKFEIRASR